MQYHFVILSVNLSDRYQHSQRLPSISFYFEAWV